MNKNKNKKVTLLELVATKIIYAALIAVYYWMWARRDWHNYYETIQYVVVTFTTIFFIAQAFRIRKFKNEVADEMAMANLKRADSICLKIATVAGIVIAFLGAMEIINHLQMGYSIMLSLIVLAIVRTVIFYVMDTRGI